MNTIKVALIRKLDASGLKEIMKSTIDYRIFECATDHPNFDYKTRRWVYQTYLLGNDTETGDDYLDVDVIEAMKNQCPNFYKKYIEGKTYEQLSNE